MWNLRDLESMIDYRKDEVAREMRQNDLVRRARVNGVPEEVESLPDPIPFAISRTRRARARVGTALIRLGTRLAA